MTHLKIEQNNGIIEEVSSAVIDKLYDIVHSGTLDNTSNLIGRLHTSATYQDYIDYLEDTFKVDGVKQLIIDATKKYMSFADPEVASYWANSTYGDGTGIDSTAANSVLSIPANAFKNNTNIQTFDELNKFSNCVALSNDAFHDSSISSINLSNITTLGTLVFSGCTNITGVFNLPSVNSIGASSLRNLNATEINIGTNVSDSNKITTIPNLAFYQDTNLQKVTGLSKVTSIGGQAFYYCSNLTSLDLTSELTTITAGEAFRGCSNLECINILNLSKLNQLATFMYCSKLVDLGTSDVNNINRGSATYTFDWDYVPSNTFTACPLTNKSFSFPNATSISTHAFNTTTGMISINIPNVTTINGYAFNKCTSLTTVSNSGNVTRINEWAFNQCSSLSSIDLSGLTYLENDSFRECTSLTTISIPNCTYIGGGSFRGCTSLQSITFASNVTYIGGIMCDNCRNLTQVQLPSNMTQLKASFFSGCTSLTSVTIPSTVTTIENNVFSNSGVTSISIPSAVTKLGTDCFTGSQLASITFEQNSTLDDLGGGCFNSTKLVTIDIPDSCTIIRNNCFMNINTLTSVTIGTGIQTIQDAFTVGNNSTYTLTIKATTPPTFTHTNSKKPTAIYVPSASVSAYQLADGWSVWADIIQAIPT